MWKWFRKTPIEDLPEFWLDYQDQFQDKLPDYVSDTRFVALDTETTGLNKKTDRILSIGAIAIKGNTIDVSESFEVYLEQQIFNPETVKIHGLIQNENLQRISEEKAVEFLLKFLGNSVLVAHHARFDVGIINQALARMKLPNLKNKVLDTAHLYRRSLIISNFIDKEKSYSLDELAEVFNIDTKDRHTAAGDAFITAMAFLQIVGKLKKEKPFTLKRLLKY